MYPLNHLSKMSGFLFVIVKIHYYICVMEKATVNISKELKQKLKVYVANNPPEKIQSFVENAVLKELNKKKGKI